MVAKLLADQADLSAVEAFAAAEQIRAPEEHKRYQQLLPAAPPGPGQQYAFEIDLDTCTGCKACVSACHSLNGLDTNEAWRSVGLIHGGESAGGYQQTVTSSCHHCVDPGCMNGCPVNAYEKDETTGIVRHLDDQCIGCQYCTLTCPYDAPKYSADRGIVRKCDMCTGRLAEGEAPACAQACPNGAIRIRVVDKAEATSISASGAFLKGAPDPKQTLPTTVYKTKREVPDNAVPGDFFTLAPQHSHPRW